MARVFGQIPGAVDAVKSRGPRFVQIAQQPSLGVEVSTGRAWAGVDQQVGHGSADALYLLTDEQYASELREQGANRELLAECWRGEHPELLLFSPGGGSWLPERWSPARSRMLPARFAGEIWRHIDALGERADGDRAGLSSVLGQDTIQVTVDDGNLTAMTLHLAGERSYPRPEALVAGLAPGSDRERAQAVLGRPVAPGSDEYAVDGARMQLGYDASGLVDVTIEHVDTAATLPRGAIGVFLSALGEPEEGPAFRKAKRLLGPRNRRWMASSRAGRRVIEFDGGTEMQVEDDRVLSVRVTPTRVGAPGMLDPDRLLPGVSWPPSRADVHGALGDPLTGSGGTELYRYGRRDLLVEYGLASRGEVAGSLVAVVKGQAVSDRFYRWRSGDVTRFLDVLGREQSNPLVDFVRALDGVTVGFRGGVVSDVEIARGSPSERFVAFVDGMPSHPTIADVPFGRPSWADETEAVWDVDDNCIHVRAGRDGAITTIAVRREGPPGLTRRGRA